MVGNSVVDAGRWVSEFRRWLDEHTERNSERAREFGVPPHPIYSNAWPTNAMLVVVTDPRSERYLQIGRCAAREVASGSVSIQFGDGTVDRFPFTGVAAVVVTNLRPYDAAMLEYFFPGIRRMLKLEG